MALKAQHGSSNIKKARLSPYKCLPPPANPKTGNPSPSTSPNLFAPLIKGRGIEYMTSSQGMTISLMLAVDDTPTAVEWYKRALGATVLWSLGSVAGLEIAGAPFFLGEPANNGWESPSKLGITSTRVEVFCDDPDSLIARALEAGALGNVGDIQDHKTLWGTHRQGGFTDPF